jgi:hypothetical protein
MMASKKVLMLCFTLSLYNFVIQRLIQDLFEHFFGMEHYVDLIEILSPQARDSLDTVYTLNYSKRPN